MKLCNEKNLKKLLVLVEEKKLFGKKLKKRLFLCFVEILKNICIKGSACQACFPRAMLKKLKKSKNEVRQLTNKKKSVTKRQKLFIASDDEFRGLIYTVLTYFFSNCVESC